MAYYTFSFKESSLLVYFALSIKKKQQKRVANLIDTMLVLVGVSFSSFAQTDGVFF